MSGSGQTSPMHDLPERPRILVIVMRRLGDVLLSTTLVRTLRAAFPRATIDLLVFQGTEVILAGNPDVDGILTLPERPTQRATLSLVRRIWRRYDHAIATQSGDRPIFLAFAAGRRCTGMVPPKGGAWKRWVLDHPVIADPDNHRVFELLRLVEPLGIAHTPKLVCPTSSAPLAAGIAPRGRYAVLHANPMYRYKRWPDEGWRTLARALAERGLAVVATGSPDPAERAYLDLVWGPVEPPVHRLDGRLDWPQLSTLIGGASVYVGSDTSVTHLAAASGCPTVALFGPTSPGRIGPWPVGGLDKPWEHVGTVQRNGNVWVVQNPLPCLPCERLGCEGHYESHSRCLDELSARAVLSVVDQALSSRSPR